MNSGPYTIQEAHQLNIEGTQTGGCWRCIQNSIGERGSRGELTENAKTQWKADKLQFIGHRSFCPNHYRKEIEGSRDF